jgi:4-carboxymuconolactone decarboxylase
MMELVSAGHSNTFEHVKSSSPTSLTQQEQTLVTISTLVALGTEPQLKLHINTGFNVGLRRRIVGALIDCIP